MMANNLFKIRQASTKDLDLILNNWLESYAEFQFSRLRSSEKFGNPWVKIPKSTFFPNHRRLAQAAIARSFVFCAADMEDPAHVYGWICVEPESGEEKPTLHYIYVKYTFRKMGVGAALMSETLKDSDFTFSHLPSTRLYQSFKGRGRFNPYRFFTGA